MVPLTLYGTDMVPPHVCMVTPHMKCLHILYDFNGPSIPCMGKVSYGPPHVLMTPYHMWNRYFMVPLTCMWSPKYGIGIT